MVHTAPFDAAKHLPHLPRIAAAAFSEAVHYSVTRPKHAKFPEDAEHYYLIKIRRRAVNPNQVIRVAVADDADPFTDLAMGEEGLWMRGSWVDGLWVSEESRLPEADRKVSEGRVLGYAAWTRTWPSSPEAAKRAKIRSGNVWPQDSIAKKVERTLFGIMDKYGETFRTDRAHDPERLNQVFSEVVAQYLSYTKSITDRLDGSTGYIYCAAVAVDPSFHRRGIGARMMRWGMELAEKEGVPILLAASDKGAGMYEKLGFEALGQMFLGSVSTDLAMVYWPKGVTRVEAQITQAVEEDVNLEDAQVADIPDSTIG